MDAPSSPVPAVVEDGTTRKSSRLKGKPKMDVVKLLSDQIPTPKVTPDDRQRLAQMRINAARTAAEARWSRARPTASIIVGSEDKKREITVYPCRVCDFLGRTPLSAKTHENKEHPHKKRCKVCNKYLHSYPELETHCFEQHQATTAAMKCEGCDFVAPDQETLDVHTEIEHYVGRRRNELCREMVDGQQCTARFLQVRELRKHLASEHGLVAALDTVQEEFATWEEFMRWKAQFELETRSVYKIGYGKRHGNRHYMCVRSGRYKPVPDEKRQRRPREHRTIKLGFNCTATMFCKFPETGGVRVVVHPFHYGHTIGDVRLPGMKPEGAPDDWIRPDVSKKKKPKASKAMHIDVMAVEQEEATVGDACSFPILTVGDGECQLQDVAAEISSQVNSQVIAQVSSQASCEESASAVAAITVAMAAVPGAPPELCDILAEGGIGAAEPGAEDGSSGDGVKSRDGPGGDAGSGGGGGGDGKPQKKPVPPPDMTRMKTLRRRRPGPLSKCGPPLSPSPPPEPEPEPEPEPRRGLFGRPLPPPPRPGPGSRYKKLLRRAKTLRGLRRQLDVHLTRLGEAREERSRSGPSAAPSGSAGGVGGPSGGSVSSCMVGTPLENVTEIAKTPPPLAVLRAEPADLDLLPDVVFPEMDLLTAPTDLQDATDTIFDLKMEVLSLRARLMRRAAVETSLRADAVDAAARHEADVRQLRDELTQTRVDLSGGTQRLRRLLDTVFSPAQVMALENPGAAVPWATEDYEQAIALRWVCSHQAFEFVRQGLRVPLPSMSAVRAMAANGRPRQVADAYLELVRAKTLEGDAVGEEVDAEEGRLEVDMVFDGPGETVEVGVDTEADVISPEVVTTPTAHDHGFSPVVVGRHPQPRRRVWPGLGTARLPAVSGSAEAATMALDVTSGDSGGQNAAADESTVLIGRFVDVEGTTQFIGPDSAGSADEHELTIAAAPPVQPPSKRARY